MRGALHRVTAVACDPGGINALIPVVRALEDGGVAVAIATSGPGGDVWDAAPTKPRARLDDDAPPDLAEEHLREPRPDLLLSGAGAYNRLEHTFRLAARRLGIPSVAVLDDRGRYRERFGRWGPRGWVPSLPDRICVMDEETKAAMVDDGFDPAAICPTGQPHLEEVERFFGALSPGEIARRRRERNLAEGEQVVAFFSEPLCEALGSPASPTSQLTALGHLGDVLRATAPGRRRNLRLLVKPHPREDPKPLRRAVASIGEGGVRAHLLEDGGALDVIAVADVVAGIFSMVLFEARLAGRPAVSIQIGHDRVDRWWGGADAGIRVATTSQDLRAALEAVLAEGPAAPSRPRFAGSTKRVLEVLGFVPQGHPPG